MKIQKAEIRHSRFIVPYRIYGESEKTIVCVSGAKQTMAAWRTFVSHFINNYSIVVFDMPGQGRSTICSGSPEVTFSEQVGILYDVVTTTGQNNPVILAAASWGTIISSALAAQRPELVDKMILGSFGSKPSKPVIEVIRAGQYLFDTNQTLEIAPLMIEKFGQYIPESHKQQMIEQFRGMSREHFISFYKHCEFVEKTKDISEFVDLSNIKARTLIVTGEYDSIVDKDDAADASRKIPNCEHKEIAGAGHFLHWEKPEILDTYSDFLDK